MGRHDDFQRDGAVCVRGATHARRASKISPEFPGLADELAPGAPMDQEFFPVLGP